MSARLTERLVAAIVVTEPANLVDVHLLLRLPTRLDVRYSGKYYHRSLE
jgi:hypothetical protein